LLPVFSRTGNLQVCLVALAAVATAVAATATTIAAAKAAGAWLHGASDIDREGATIHLLAVQAFNGGLCFCSRTHFHKAKAFGAACVTFHHDFGGSHVAVSCELLLQRVIAHGVGKIADVEFVVHEC